MAGGVGAFLNSLPVATALHNTALPNPPFCPDVQQCYNRASSLVACSLILEI